ncbi:hypothetical protein BM1_06162 [Bipolaris maydis]|nr:hypothetical protein BM1_06162 [Bipolaris maydis]
MYSIVAVPHTGERKDVEDSVPEDLTEPFDPETGIDPRKQPSGRDGQEVGSDRRHKRLQLLLLRHGVEACEAGDHGIRAQVTRQA